MVFLFQVEAAEECNGPSPDQTRRLLEEEFNVQRAKMKELFLQKEGSLSVISSVGRAGVAQTWFWFGTLHEISIIHMITLFLKWLDVNAFEVYFGLWILTFCYGICLIVGWLSCGFHPGMSHYPVFVTQFLLLNKLFVSPGGRSCQHNTLTALFCLLCIHPACFHL